MLNRILVESAPPAWDPRLIFADESDHGYWWLVRLRWLALAAVIAVVGAAGPLAGVLEEDAALAMAGVAGALVLYNGALTALGPRRSGAAGAFTVQILADCAALAGLVHFGGGIENPFLMLFVLHAVNANIVLKPRPALLVVLAAIGLIGAIVLGEARGLIAHHCLFASGVLPGVCLSGAWDHWILGMFGGAALTVAFAGLLTRSLTSRLRSQREHLAQTVRALSDETGKLAASRREVARMHERVQAVIDGMQDAVLVRRGDGAIELCNRQAERLWPGLGATDDGAWKDALPPPLRDAKGRESTAFTWRHRHFDLSSAPLDAAGSGATLLVARDVTERVSLQEGLAREERMIALGKLAAVVAHEINNPIGVVSMYSQHALDRLPDAGPVRSHLETIHRNAQDCQRIVEHLLSLSRPRAVTRQTVALDEICATVGTSVAALARAHDVQVTVELSGPGDPVLAFGNADQLRQALLNLGLNAVDAAGSQGRVSMRVFWTRTDLPRRPALEVQDSGPGIPEDLQAQVFEPFFTTKAKGTGLGLAVTRTIVEDHQGELTVRNLPGSGACLRITLQPPKAAHE